jgi:hypothetical protein
MGRIALHMDMEIIKPEQWLDKLKYLGHHMDMAYLVAEAHLKEVHNRASIQVWRKAIQTRKWILSPTWVIKVRQKNQPARRISVLQVF